MGDFRAQRMPSPEGRGIARGRWQQAWDAYSRAVEKAAAPVVEPLLRPITSRIGAARAEETLGFWLLWHLEGGFEGLQRLGMSRSGVYRRVAAFRKLTGVHPDEFKLPGVTLDLEAYVAASASTGPQQAEPPPIGDEPDTTS
ncbi:hypothetical protein [Motilibacter deserti]|uniref:Uncharacterized protein n=1 Tax=Motilibacter deserti TaxID=2714956 RepID=A0ABX0GVE7_9ACTN|nr:hypothetical protein [Motilibacter deserti]NHC14121.1 hypothetical protein [Motilibacter deserti]